MIVYNLARFENKTTYDEEQYSNLNTITRLSDEAPLRDKVIGHPTQRSFEKANNNARLIQIRKTQSNNNLSNIC